MSEKLNRPVPVKGDKSPSPAMEPARPTHPLAPDPKTPVGIGATATPKLEPVPPPLINEPKPSELEQFLSAVIDATESARLRIADPRGREVMAIFNRELKREREARRKERKP